MPHTSSSRAPNPGHRHRDLLLLTNARAWTGSRRRPWAEAVAIDGERIATVGTSAEIMKLATRAGRVIDARGAMIVPGFIDAHVHLIESALRLASVQLRDVTSREQFLNRIRVFAERAEPGSWITGGDWDHYRWGGDLPTREWVDAAAPEHPVFVSRHDGHQALASSVALRLAGVDARTPDPEGGLIVRDAAGEPTGVLKDSAMLLVSRVQPPPSADAVCRSLADASRYLVERGVTSVHHMGTWEQVGLLRAARDAGALKVRVAAAVPMESWERLRDELQSGGEGDDWLRLLGLKAFADGSLGSHTAAFLEPYADAPDDFGIFVTEPERLRRLTRDADAHGLQPIVHAIGDRAVRAVLDIFAALPSVPGRERCPRIEHAQHVHPSDAPRFAELGVVASMQPYHLADDGCWAARVIGEERVPHAFPVGTLARLGAPLAFGSDWFVAPPEPLAAIHAAATRRTLDGLNPGGWTPSERIGAEEALRAHTAGAARAERAADRKGVIERGYLADLVMIDRDITAIAPEEVSGARILLTVLNGEVVHEDAKQPAERDARSAV